MLGNLPLSTNLGYWNTYQNTTNTPPKKKLAPLERNKLIVDNCDCLLALWDGASRGTKYTIDLAVRKGKPVKIYNYLTKEESRL